jgi:hypothetical protein
MMTLQEAKPIAERLRPEGSIGTTTNASFDIDTPMACESYVADAVSHLLSGFLIVEDLAAAIRPVGGSQTPLDRSSKDIATVLVELNDCSVGFWLMMPRAPVSRVARLRGFCAPSKCRRSTPEGGKSDAAAAGALEVKQPQGVEFRAGPLARKRPEWANSLALATLHLVGAHRAMERLSESSFPMGAPGSFELACHCLCAALATLDACFANCEG